MSGAGVMWPPTPPPRRTRPEGICAEAMAPHVFPDWHWTTARLNGQLWMPAQWPTRMDYNEPRRRSQLYGEPRRSPLLASDTWALEVRVYAPQGQRYTGYLPDRGDNA